MSKSSFYKTTATPDEMVAVATAFSSDFGGASRSVWLVRLRLRVSAAARHVAQ